MLAACAFVVCVASQLNRHGHQRNHTPSQLIYARYISILRIVAGTTINTLFKSKTAGGAGGLTPAGQQLLRHERENSWDPGYRGALRPNSSFIIGTIRNPFVSFFLVG